MGIVTSTLNEWKKQFSELSETLKNSKERADAIVENALYKSATGFEVVEEIEEEKNGVKYFKRTKKQIPPNIAAIIFYLKNRKGRDWQDNPKEHDDTGNEIKITLDWNRD